MRLAIRRNAPYGLAVWTQQAANRLGLQSMLRPRGRPRKRADGWVESEQAARKSAGVFSFNCLTLKNESVWLRTILIIGAIGVSSFIVGSGLGVLLSVFPAHYGVGRPIEGALRSYVGQGCSVMIAYYACPVGIATSMFIYLLSMLKFIEPRRGINILAVCAIAAGSASGAVLLLIPHGNGVGTQIVVAISPAVGFFPGVMIGWFALPIALSLIVFILGYPKLSPQVQFNRGVLVCEQGGKGDADGAL